MTIKLAKLKGCFSNLSAAKNNGTPSTKFDNQGRSLPYKLFKATATTTNGFLGALAGNQWLRLLVVEEFCAKADLKASPKFYDLVRNRYSHTWCYCQPPIKSVDVVMTPAP